MHYTIFQGKNDLLLIALSISAKSIDSFCWLVTSGCQKSMMRTNRKVSPSCQTSCSKESSKIMNFPSFQVLRRRDIKTHKRSTTATKKKHTQNKTKNAFLMEQDQQQQKSEVFLFSSSFLFFFFFNFCFLFYCLQRCPLQGNEQTGIDA